MLAEGNNYSSGAKPLPPPPKGVVAKLAATMKEVYALAAYRNTEGPKVIC